MFFYSKTIPWTIISINLKDEKWTLHQSHCRIPNSLVITWRRLFLVFISLARLELQCTVRWRCTRRQRRRNFVYFFHCNHDSAIRNSIFCWSHFMISAVRCICTFPCHPCCGLGILCGEYRCFSSVLAHVIQTWNDCRYSGKKDDCKDFTSAPWKPSSIAIGSGVVIIVVVNAVYTLSAYACRSSNAVTVPMALGDIWPGRRWTSCSLYAFPRVTVTYGQYIWAISITCAPLVAVWSRSTNTTANLPLTTLRIVVALWLNTASEADQGQTKRRRPNMHQLFNAKQQNNFARRGNEAEIDEAPFSMIRPFQWYVTAAMETGTKIRKLCNAPFFGQRIQITKGICNLFIEGSVEFSVLIN